MLVETSSFLTDLQTSVEAIGNFKNVTDSYLEVEIASDVMLIFFSCVILIGFIGCVANGFVLSVLLSPKLRMQSFNLLIINQVAMDLYSCILLVGSNVSRLPRLRLTGSWGWFLCAFVQNDFLIFVGLTGSIASVGTITAERYFKVVHPIAHRKNFRNWMIYAVIPLTWINGVLTNATGIWTSKVMDGKCNSYSYWPSQELVKTYSSIIFVWQYFMPLLLFIYCYWRILAVIRRQTKVFQGQHGNDVVAQQATVNKTQMNVITTMIGICLAFFVCWTPNQILYMLGVMGYIVSSYEVGYQIYSVTLFLIFLNTTLNPFIYAVKHEAVKKGLRRMLGKKSDLTTNAPETIMTSN